MSKMCLTVAVVKSYKNNMNGIDLMQIKCRNKLDTKFEIKQYVSQKFYFYNNKSEKVRSVNTTFKESKQTIKSFLH